MEIDKLSKKYCSQCGRELKENIKYNKIKKIKDNNRHIQKYMSVII